MQLAKEARAVLRATRSAREVVQLIPSKVEGRGSGRWWALVKDAAHFSMSKTRETQFDISGLRIILDSVYDATEEGKGEIVLEESTSLRRNGAWDEPEAFLGPMDGLGSIDIAGGKIGRKLWRDHNAAASALSACVGAFANRGMLEESVHCFDQLGNWGAWPHPHSMWSFVRGVVYKQMDVRKGLLYAQRYAWAEHNCRGGERGAWVGLEHVKGDEPVGLWEAGLRDGKGWHGFVPRPSLLAIVLRGCAREMQAGTSDTILKVVAHQLDEKLLGIAEYTALLDLRCRQRDGAKALETIYKMQENNIEPDLQVFELILRLCEQTKSLDMASKVWKQIQVAGLQPDLLCFLTHMRCAARVGDSRRVYELYHQLTDTHTLSQRQQDLVDEVLSNVASGVPISKREK